MLNVTKRSKYFAARKSLRYLQQFAILLNDILLKMKPEFVLQELAQELGKQELDREVHNNQ